MGAYRWTNTVPNNNTIPYTGSDLDFEQTRHAFGGEALVAVRPGRGHWHFEFGGGYYPYVYAIADSPGSVFAGSSMVDAHAMLGYEVVPGLRLGLGASYERWTGAGDDTGLKQVQEPPPQSPSRPSGRLGLSALCLRCNGFSERGAMQA